MTQPHVVSIIQKNARESVRVALDSYRGHNLVDLRIFVPLTAHTDVLSPTPKGVSLNVALIPQLRDALAVAEIQARKLGWIG